MTFEQQWLEYDYNPFVLFNSHGKIVSVNAEAQFLLGTVTSNELFELAKAYANITFGFKTTFVDLEFGRYKFFGLTIGYEDEEQLGIKLYQAPSFKLNTPKPEGKLTNIYTILDLCMATNSIGSNTQYIKKYDPTIPDIIIDTDKFIKLLNKVYGCFLENDTITTKVFYRIGEHIKFQEKKYSIFSIEVDADQINETELRKLKLVAQENDFYVDITRSITLNIPMITS
jgi:hypothetical protein